MWGLNRQRRMAADQVLESGRFVTEIEKFAHRLERTPESVRQEAQKGLREIIAVKDRYYSYLWDHVLRPMHTNAWSVDWMPEQLEGIRKLNDKGALVFLPTHRSYADPYVLTHVLQESGLPRNSILGGNNQDFFPLGAILKNSGGVLIRRSFRDDQVYKLVVKEYLAYLVASGSNLEWYMEGGRSRSGKLRPPMFGLLRYLVRAVEVGAAQDLTLVPVSMTYDHMHEIGRMAEEEAGIRSKTPEGVRWLASYARMQQKWIGNVHVRFGEPLSLKSALSGGADENNSPWAVEKVAFEVFQRINRVTPVTAPSLVTLALLAAKGRALTLAEVTRYITPLLAYADQRGLPTEAVDKLRDETGVYTELLRLAESGVIERYEAGEERVFQIGEGKHAVAAFYRNSAIHWFVNRAILEVALLSVVDETGEGAIEHAWENAYEIRDLLKFEFFFSDKERFQEEIKEESRILSTGFRKQTATPNGRRKLVNNAPFLVAHRVLTQFLEAYFLLADRLAEWPAKQPVDEKALLEQCSKVGRQYVLQRRLSNPESVSRELCGNAIKLAHNRGLMEPGRGIVGKRRAFKQQISALVDVVSELAALDGSAVERAR